MAALRTDREFQSERELQASICLIFVFPLLVFYWIFVSGGLSKWQQANEAYLKAAFSEAGTLALVFRWIRLEFWQTVHVCFAVLVEPTLNMSNICLGLVTIPTPHQPFGD